MALSEFFGWTEQQLLAAQFKAQTDVANGAAITAFGDGGSNSAQAIQLAAEVRVQKIQRALYETDPVRYSMFASVGQNRSTPVFNVSSRQY